MSFEPCDSVLLELPAGWRSHKNSSHRRKFSQVSLVMSEPARPHRDTDGTAGVTAQGPSSG